MRICYLLTLLSVLVGAVSNSVAQTEADGPYWIRQPQISPDGQSIVFTYRGQIWIVPSAGGEAIPLTERQFRSTAPVWSPDSRLVAFGSDRYSVSDVFVMPVEGGPITRLTHNSQLARPLAFSADGNQVLFAAARLGDPEADYLRGLGGSLGMIHSVPVAGGRERLVMPFPTRQADVSPDGGTIAYVKVNSVEQEWRKREISDGTSDIWLYDIEAKTHRRLTDYRGRDRSPAFSADGGEIYWTTEMSEAESDPDAAPGTFNVWRMPVDGGGAPTRVTGHDTLPVRFASVADDGTLVYTYDTELWRLDPGSTEPVKVPVRMRQGTLYTGDVFTDLTGEVSEMAVSPDGAEIALVARGDIFVLSPATGETRRITATPQTERSVSYAPDGRALLYAAERTGDWDIFVTELVREADTSFLEAVQMTERVLIDTGTDALQPAYSPDGERVAYRDDRNAIRIWDAATGESRELLPDDATYFYGEGDFDFEWSADGGYIVTTTGFAVGNTEIELLDTTGDGERHRISESGFGDSSPGFSPDGSVVFWATDRFSQRNLDEQGGLRDMMAAYLTPEGYVQRELGRQALPAEEPDEQTAEEPAGETDDAEAGIVPDFDGLPYRKARLTGAPVIPVLAEMTPDNAQMILVAVQPPASLVGTVIDMATGQPRQLFAQSAAGVQALAASPDRSALFILRNAQIERVDVATGQSTPVPLSIEAPVDFNAEMQYIFDHQWRLVQSKFYDADMHGVDWPAMRDAYAKYLPHISHWEDFAELLSELQGELDASHMYVHFASDNPAWDQTAELGIYFDTSHEGPGVQVREVLPGGPADLVGPPLQAGAVISAVDGVEISADQDIYPLLDRKAGRVLRLTVQPSDGGAPADQFVRAAAPGAEYELAYERWVEKRRAMVDELSGGRLGYTHVRGMDDASFRQVYADLMGPARDREGAIIDTRFNLGGLLHDQLTAFLTGERHSGLVTRTGVDLGTSPFTRWAKPTALIMNSWNYSDASVFPYYYIREEIGPSVGDRVPGTGTAVLSLPQQEPRLTIAFAQLGFRTMEGDFFENREIVPDEIVRADPDALEEGRDPQLEAAVAALIRAIDD